MNLGATELLIILGIVLLLFGTTRLPKLAKSVGLASKEFKKGVSEGPSDLDDDDDIEKARAEPKELGPKDAEKRAST